MEPIHYVGMLAQILTYASFLSGAKVCHQIYQQRSCANLSPAPFLAGLHCTILWLRYGFVADEWEIIAVNSVGLVCQLVYLAFFVVYSRQKARLLKQLAVSVLFLGTLLWSVDHSVDPKFLVGSYASLSSSLACASPLATIQEVLKTRCVASLPFPIIASSFVVSLSWLLFGVLKADSFIIFSNVVAVLITGAQLVLFAVYPSTLPYEKLTPSNKKSIDLIRLLHYQDGEEDPLDPDSDINSDEIDTNQNYKEVLSRIMGNIYSKREKMTKTSSSVMLLTFGRLV